MATFTLLVEGSPKALEVEAVTIRVEDGVLKFFGGKGLSKDATELVAAVPLQRLYLVVEKGNLSKVGA